MDRLQNTFDALSETGDTAIIPFITAGFPSVEDTLRLVPALVEGGASIIELGVPYSDPLADGHTIQRASFKALENGVTPSDCLSMVAKSESPTQHWHGEIARETLPTTHFDRHLGFFCFSALEKKPCCLTLESPTISFGA